MGDGEMVDAMIHQSLGRPSPDSTWASRPTRSTLCSPSHARTRTRGRHVRISAPRRRESRRFAELVGVHADGSGDVLDDEGIRPETTLAVLATLPPAFNEDGTITAGNASQLADGAAALVVMSAERAEALGLEPLAEIVTHAMCADRFAYLHTVPAIALAKALDRSGLAIDDLGLVEINEAAASVAVHATHSARTKRS